MIQKRFGASWESPVHPSCFLGEPAWHVLGSSKLSPIAWTSYLPPGALLGTFHQLIHFYPLSHAAKWLLLL